MSTNELRKQIEDLLVQFAEEVQSRHEPSAAAIRSIITLAIRQATYIQINGGSDQAVRDAERIKDLISELPSDMRS